VTWLNGNNRTNGHSLVLVGSAGYDILWDRVGLHAELYRLRHGIRWNQYLNLRSHCGADDGSLRPNMFGLLTYTSHDSEISRKVCSEDASHTPVVQFLCCLQILTMKPSSESFLYLLACRLSRVFVPGGAVLTAQHDNLALLSVQRSVVRHFYQHVTVELDSSRAHL